MSRFVLNGRRVFIVIRVVTAERAIVTAVFVLVMMTVLNDHRGLSTIYCPMAVVVEKRMGPDLETKHDEQRRRKNTAQSRSTLMI